MDTREDQRIPQITLDSMRIAAGYKNAADFADAFGMDRDVYAEYESGAKEMTLEQAWAFADALDCKISDLIK